jgi:hypothetical protein
MSPKRSQRRTKPTVKKSPPKSPPKKVRRLVDDVEVASGPTTTLKIDGVESEEELEAEAVVVTNKRDKRGVGKPKDNKPYETGPSDPETEEEDTRTKQEKSSSSKKGRKSTLDQTAKKWKERATRAE